MRSLLIVAAVSVAAVACPPRPAPRRKAFPMILNCAGREDLRCDRRRRCASCGDRLCLPGQLQRRRTAGPLHLRRVRPRPRVACSGYGRPNSDAWYTINFAKRTQAEVQGRRSEGHGARRNSGPPRPRRATPKPPLPQPGLPPCPRTRAAFWTSTNDLVDGLWFAEIGPWQVDLRATYSAGHEAEVAAVAKAVWTQVFEEVKGPEV